MFSNKYRLKKSQEIAKVFKNGKCIYGKYVFIKYLPNNDINSRISISISTKLFKQATKRNRIKRLIREAMKSHLSTSQLQSLNILIIAKKTLPSDITLQKIKQDISNIFKKI